MVKDDSLYIVAIVAVVAVVGLVIMATGSSSTVMVAEDLPSMAEDSDNSAIAGQAITSRLKIDSKPVTSELCDNLFNSKRVFIGDRDLFQSFIEEEKLNHIGYNLNIRGGELIYDFDVSNMNEGAINLFNEFNDILTSAKIEMDCDISSEIFESSDGNGNSVIIDLLDESCDADGDGVYELTVSSLTTESSDGKKTTITESTTVCDQDSCETEEDISTTVDECFPKINRGSYYNNLCSFNIRPLGYSVERLLLACVSSY